ncbi:hypothetical protein BT93_L1261 [Corymbia citriodora subsp. variegata]|uniref:Uncharacterized protein n=1 Tax=Corymbia citriodora subsp. variegata TaxID=360336 RepID=A0A8T0CSK5_CORYI|nr:hypothetical protein BT93_L1261 [Corymbia citriodora subsp. variegata]
MTMSWEIVAWEWVAHPLPRLLFSPCARVLPSLLRPYAQRPHQLLSLSSPLLLFLPTGFSSPFSDLDRCPTTEPLPPPLSCATDRRTATRPPPEPPESVASVSPLPLLLCFGRPAAPLARRNHCAAPEHPEQPSSAVRCLTPPLNRRLTPPLHRRRTTLVPLRDYPRATRLPNPLNRYSLFPLFLGFTSAEPARAGQPPSVQLPAASP